jgi:hypothetical protein
VIEAGINPYVTWGLDLAQAAAAAANYCDHVEHNEPAERVWVTDAARTIRETALAIATHENEDLIGRYAARVRQIERRNPLWSDDAVDGGELVLSASTWRDLQLAQVTHDRYYHPDVVGLTKLDQLRHYVLHLAKLVGAVADIAAGDGDRTSFFAHRLPDLLLFGIKLATVTGECLADEPVPATCQPLGSASGWPGTTDA